MGDGDHCYVIGTDFRRCHRKQDVLVLGFVSIGPRIINIHFDIHFQQLVDDIFHPRIADIRAIPLKVMPITSTRAPYTWILRRSINRIISCMI